MPSLKCRRPLAAQILRLCTQECLAQRVDCVRLAWGHVASADLRRASVLLPGLSVLKHLGLRDGLLVGSVGITADPALTYLSGSQLVRLQCPRPGVVLLAAICF